MLFRSGAATLSFSSAGLPTVASNSFMVGSSFTFSGFYEPIDNAHVNVVEAGRRIPFKFSIVGVPDGTAVVLSVTSTQEACQAPTRDDHGYRGKDRDWNDGKKGWHDDDDQDEDAKGHYDRDTRRYHYNWKTDKAWARTCRELVVRLADGTEHVAAFTLK